MEHIDKKYVRDAKTGKKATRLYAYGVSLGANILGLYLVKMGEQATQTLDAAILYGTSWNLVKGNKYLYEKFYGLISKVVGLSHNDNILKTQLPKFEPLMSKEDFEELSHAISSNTTGLDHIDKHV